jgi:DUF4097 and DUF4098 domain-containing protein YvlB
MATRDLQFYISLLLKIAKSITGNVSIPVSRRKGTRGVNQTISLDLELLLAYYYKAIRHK